jgi:hypothetical protein
VAIAFFFGLKKVFQGHPMAVFRYDNHGRGMRGNNNIYWYMEFAGIVRGGGES